jgi:hypothetical protein
MNPENLFRKKSLPEEHARQMYPHELKAQADAIEAASEMNLGNEIQDQDLSTLSDEELLQISAGHMSDEEYSASLNSQANEALQALNGKVQEEYETLIQKKENLSAEARHTLEEIEEFIQDQQQTRNRDTSCMEALMIFTKPVMHNPQEVENILNLFSPEVKSAILNRHQETKINSEISNIRHLRGGRLHEELLKRGLIN